MPLNMYHPPSGLFVKDCNEQCIDDLVKYIFILVQQLRDPLFVELKIPKTSKEATKTSCLNARLLHWRHGDHHP